MITTAVKERPILFSGPMVRAILDGRKTQTRRIAKLNETLLRDEYTDVKAAAIEAAMRICPYGQPGERLWVRETWALRSDVDYRVDPSKAKHYALYRATYEGCLEDEWHSVDGWKPSIHMPRILSRINLEITDVRVQRLQEISEEDAIAEGAQCAGFPASLTNYGAFGRLWQKINGSDSWDANPWVWAISFKRI